MGVVHVFLLCLMIWPSYGQNPCIETSRCSCKTSEGWINLQPLDNPSNPLTVTDWNGDVYTYNPCTVITVNSGCTNMAVCQEREGFGYPLGNMASESWSSAGIVTYTATDSLLTTRVAQITLTCDPNDPGSLTSQGEYPTGTHDLTLNSMYACPDPNGGPGGSPGGGSSWCWTWVVIPLIVFMSLMMVLFVVCIICKRCTTDAAGNRQVINISIGTAVPGFAKNGLSFTANKMERMCGKEPIYETV